MRFSVSRETLLKPLQMVGNIVERRQTKPVLFNVLIKVSDQQMELTATDMELEMSANIDLDVAEAGEITVPARKFTDICKALPDGAQIEVNLDFELQRLVVRSGRSRFNLSTLPANQFPNLENIETIEKFQVPQKLLKSLIESTHFAMALQDIRFYLNGMLLEVDQQSLRTVATDGHRLALSERNIDIAPDQLIRIILPRKGVLELAKLLDHADTLVDVEIGKNHLRVVDEKFRFTTKLVNGKFPEYQGVIPKDGDRTINVERHVIHDALARTAILSNEKYRGIRIRAANNLLQASAHNPEREEAEEEIEVEMFGPDLETGYNVNYLLDALNNISAENVSLKLGGESNSCVIDVAQDNGRNLYVIMPMKL